MLLSRSRSSSHSEESCSGVTDSATSLSPVPSSFLLLASSIAAPPPVPSSPPVAHRPSTDVSLTDVLENATLREAFKWHCVSVFAFENLFFLDKVERTWRPLFGDEHADREDWAQRVSECAQELMRTFLKDGAPWQVTLGSADRQKLCQQLKQDAHSITEDVFDRAIATVMRDLARSLNLFKNSEIFMSWALHREVLESLFCGVAGPPVGSADTTNFSRKLSLLYRGERVALEPTSEGNYAFVCKVDGVVEGWARKDPLVWRFYDKQHRQIFLTAAAGVTGPPPTTTSSATASTGAPVKNATKLSRSPSFTAGDTSALSRKGRPTSLDGTGLLNTKGVRQIGRSSTCDNIRPRASTTTAILLDDTAFVFLCLPQHEPVGPVCVMEVRRWWKYHLLHPFTRLRVGFEGDFKRLAEFQGFDRKSQLQIDDPTQVTF